MTVAIKQCTKCFAKPIHGEEWTQNGTGWLCERCSSNGTVKRGLGLGRGLGPGLGLTPVSAPSSSSSFHSPSFQEDDEFRPDDDVPPATAWLLHRESNPGPVELPEKVQAVADFFAKVHTLRIKAGEHRPVPFGCAWVGRHLGISKATVWRALRILEAEGVLKKMDPLPGRKKKGVATYLPGDGVKP